MANNKDELTSESNTKLVPTITDDILKDFINNDLINSLVLRKDKIGTATPSGGNVTADFTTNDLVTITASSSVVVSFTGLENGDVKHLKVTKKNGDTISFSGAIDMTNFSKYIDFQYTTVVYVVTVKDNVIYVNAVNQTIREATSTDIEESNSLKFPLASSVNEYVSEIQAALYNHIDNTKKAESSDFDGTASNDKYTTPALLNEKFSMGSGIQITQASGWTKNIAQGRRLFSGYLSSTEYKASVAFFIKLTWSSGQTVAGQDILISTLPFELTGNYLQYDYLTGHIEVSGNITPVTIRIDNNSNEMKIMNAPSILNGSILNITATLCNYEP